MAVLLHFAGTDRPPKAGLIFPSRSGELPRPHFGAAFAPLEPCSGPIDDMHRLRDLTINLMVSLASALLFLALCEFVVFRFVWLASDTPRLDFRNDIVRYAPNQRGIWRVRDEIAAPYRINAQGWNSGSGDYVRERHPGVARIAVVGDSFVEALQVPYDSSLAEVLGRELNDKGQPAEIYRFGISGAPLSQYVHMVEREVVGYRPDWIVVNVVHNDFDESYDYIRGRYTSSFMKFKVADGKVTGETPPAPWQPGLIETLRLTATVRFLFYRWQVHPQALIDLLLPRPAGAAEPRYQANIDVGRVLANRRDIEAVSDHALARLAALAASIGARLLVVMDGDRHAIYRGQLNGPVLALNRILGQAAERHHIAFLDLQPEFAADWAAHHRRFDFDVDGHWNELAHAIAAIAIAGRIRQAR
jgi:GDSL-like Lipase/Acylhydrolase family